MGEQMEKKHRVFLGLGFSAFALSALWLVWILIKEYLRLQVDFPNDHAKVMNDFSFGILIVILCIAQGLALELSFIRSVYKTLKHELEGGVKACYVISVLLALIALVFLCFVLLAEIPDKKWILGFYPSEILMLTGWPVFLVSFILGSLPVGRVSIDTTPSKDVF